MATLTNAAGASVGGSTGFVRTVKTPASVTGVTTKTVLATIPIPAGTFVDGLLRVQLLFSATNNANAKTVGFDIGGVTFHGTSMASNASLNTIWAVRSLAANSQVSMPASSFSGSGGSTSAVLKTTVDFTVDQTLSIYATLGVTTDSATLEHALIEVVK